MTALAACQRYWPQGPNSAFERNLQEFAAKLDSELSGRVQRASVVHYSGRTAYDYLELLVDTFYVEVHSVEFQSKKHRFGVFVGLKELPSPHALLAPPATATSNEAITYIKNYLGIKPLALPEQEMELAWARRPRTSIFDIFTSRPGESAPSSSGCVVR